jgi:hypothetical protein
MSAVVIVAPPAAWLGPASRATSCLVPIPLLFGGRGLRDLCVGPHGQEGLSKQAIACRNPPAGPRRFGELETSLHE